MQTISARIGAVVLVVTALYQPQTATAFDLRLGPFHLSFPGRHTHARRIARSERTARPERISHSDQVARSEPATAAAITAPEPAESASPSVLFPVLAWPSLYDDVFWPQASTPWAFSYESIFSQAFSRYSPQHVSAFCPYRASTDEIVTRITRETTPNAAQKPLLEQLATALSQANGYLIKSCPNEIPAQPVARLWLMEDQIDTVIMALDSVRPRLQAFEKSLDDQQRARLNGPRPASGGAIPACRSSPGAVNEQLSQLEQAVQLTDAQRPALPAVEDAFHRAAATLDDNCSGEKPPTALGRLEAIENRLDVTWQAVQTIQVALANFQEQLSDEQNSRLNALQIASTR